MKDILRSEAASRAVRTFIITFVVTTGAGFLGFLNALTEWARTEGQTPLPDATSLAYLAVTGILAAVIAVGNYLWNIVENALGTGMFRDIETDHFNK